MKIWEDHLVLINVVNENCLHDVCSLDVATQQRTNDASGGQIVIKCCIQHWLRKSRSLLGEETGYAESIRFIMESDVEIRQPFPSTPYSVGRGETGISHEEIRKEASWQLSKHIVKTVLLSMYLYRVDWTNLNKLDRKVDEPFSPSWLQPTLM